MAHALVSDIAQVVRIDTFRSTPLIVDGSTEAKSALERTFSPRLGFLEEFPAELLPETARGLFSDGINPSSSELA
jgi:hypothetical protein